MRLLIIIIFVLSSSQVSAQSAVDDNMRALERAILQRDEIIKSLIKRLDLLEGEVETLKNKSDIQNIVDRSLKNNDKPEEQSSVIDNQQTVATAVGEENKQVMEVSLIEEAFERQLLDRGGLVLPLYASVVELGFNNIHSSVENILIDGFTIFPVLVVGDIVSERVRKDITQVSVAWRMGLPLDTQVDVNVPWSYLDVSRVEADSVEENNYDTGLGDIEIGLSYQLFNDHETMPDSTVSMRWKTTTGDDPYGFSSPENHQTGSGFDALNLNYTFVTVNDPFAYYGGLSYTYNFDDKKDFGRVKPGDTIGYSLGASLAINLKSSINFGFSQSWTEKTKLDRSKLAGTELNTATFNVGLNYIFDQDRSINTSLGIGLTEDSPDFQFGVGLPIRFGF